ncbi:MAM and LDL-receptor class A domain-containing protein 2 isoform 2-T2 [Synchiropus picturatus]
MFCASVLSINVSACTVTQFQYKTGACVSDQLVCDFKEDCEDGSDEEFCGSCDFELHTCGWRNISEESFSWSRQRANITTKPGLDHTMGTPWGHVMYVGSEQGRFFGTADLEYSVSKVAALGCQLSFWYSFHPTGSSSSPTALDVLMVRGQVATELLSISKRETNGWESATVFIGNLPEGYQLRFSYERPFSGSWDVMLDDISFEFCGDEDVPAGSDQLSCDFEQNTCSWYRDLSSSFQWERSRGTYDGPEGNGYYMTVESQRDPEVAARLISYPQPAGRVICVSFMYHIFGNSIGSLKFITKHPGEEEKVVWMRTGTQGNKWRFADLTFLSDKPTQFIIEATGDGKQGSISIDDITVSSSETGSCPAERECSFQGSLCGLQHLDSSSFSWNRTAGASQPTNSSGPNADHTLGTDQGYYLSAQLWKQVPGSRGAMVTAQLEPTPSEGECLVFWYYMEGPNVGELSVHLQTIGNSKKLWSRSGDQGTHWRHARVHLLNPSTAYQVVFEAVVGEGPRRDIAIDDITFQFGPCPPPGYCDFEMDFCGWVNDPPAESGMDWDWLSGTSGGHFVPNKDHSTNSPLGHFAIFNSYNSEGKEVARLESESMAAVEKACLELWHQASGWGVDRPSDITFTVLVSESGGLRTIFETNGFTNSSWIQDKVDYSSPEPHQLILQANWTGSSEGGFAIDDVHVRLNEFCTDPVPTTTPVPVSTTPQPPTSLITCSFEEGLCSWIKPGADDTVWTLRSGDEVHQPRDGPYFDHTIQNNQGRFLLLNGSGSMDGESASLSVSVSNFSQVCVGFWYYMLGPSVSSLDLVLESNSSNVLVWTRRGSQSPQWMSANVNVDMTDATQVLKLTGHRDINSEGFMAVDDVTVRDGACRVPDVCGFDTDWCGFEKGVGNSGHWDRKQGSQNAVDHTYGTMKGYYMTAVAAEAELLTRKFRSNEVLCVQFRYRLTDSTATLSVHILDLEGPGDTLWQRSGASHGGWEVARVTVFSPTPFHVVFKAAGTSLSVHLDDFSVRNGACSPVANCDFESGLCNWVNIPPENGHEWVLTSGGSDGPTTDHTTGAPHGGFLLSMSPNRRSSSSAKVASEWMSPGDSPACVTLWYQTDGSTSSLLRVSMRSESAEELLLQTNSSELGWSRFSWTVEPTEPFQLLLDAATVGSGFVAVDDVGLTPGPCAETSSDFANCTFEESMCGWKDMSDGPCQWGRRNASDDYGPSTDHTVGTELGWYMAVEPARGGHLSPAHLQSPSTTESSSTCSLHFYFSTQGDDMEELSVGLQESSRITPLWWHSGSSGGIWQRAEVTVGRLRQDFHILFQASRGFNKPGHVAIDDITFVNCLLPEPEPCPESMFMCDNKACVERSSVCDFTDDCGDWSDENHCDLQRIESCNLEQGMCSWSRRHQDTPGGVWRWLQGQDAWPDLGPARDHTLSNGAGHFVIPGTDLTSEMVSRTLLPSSNCNIQFYYFSLNDAAGRLSVLSRTHRAGFGDTELWTKADSQSYSWQRADVKVSSTLMHKVVVRYERGEGPGGLVALDDISFSSECKLDPDNNELPDVIPTTSEPPTPPAHLTTSSRPNPCQDDQFFCWRSAAGVCIAAGLQCDYSADCPQSEDEDGCGPCTFERDQCKWASVGKTWLRQKASNNSQPPTDHTTSTGTFMSVRSPTQSEATLQSPPLPPSSPFCQISFHFHISSECAGSLRVLIQQANGSEAIVWSRSHSTVPNWTPESLPLGPHLQPFKVWFSAVTQAHSRQAGECVYAVDDVSFVNCEQDFLPPALTNYSCNFEEGLCIWKQAADDDLDWSVRSGPTETPNTGPPADHTSGTGSYLYMESSPPTAKGSVARLKSSPLPPAGEEGYCLSFWYHMSGATVGSLRILLQSTDPWNRTLVWQKSGDQGEEWLLARSHVTLQDVHQVILEATVGGEAGDVAVDDLALASGPCPTSDVCDFEEGSCNWQQETEDDADWIRQSGPTFNPNTGPDSDHTTESPAGHYYYLPSSGADRAGDTAVMSSPLYGEGKGVCVQLWYHMFGAGVGTLNVYQRSENKQRHLVFSRTGDQGEMWRFAQAPLLPYTQPFRLVVEGVKSGPTQEGDMAFDDVRLTDTECPPAGHCDFESNMCGWRNLAGDVDQADWLRGRGASTTLGPSVDHTTNSSQGYYLYVDNSVGEWGTRSLLSGDVLQPSTRGHCLRFWYYMFGDVGTLRVSVNDRQTSASGNEEGFPKWTESGNNGNEWKEASVFITLDEPFWVVFVSLRGKETAGYVALDDVTILPGPCLSEVVPPPGQDPKFVVLIVALTLLAGLVIVVCLVVVNRKCWSRSGAVACDHVTMSGSVIDLFSGSRDDTETGVVSFSNSLYDPSARGMSST